MNDDAKNYISIMQTKVFANSTELNMQTKIFNHVNFCYKKFGFRATTTKKNTAKEMSSKDICTLKKYSNMFYSQTIE